MSVQVLVKALAVSLCLLQFLVVPFFAGASEGGKAYFLLFTVLTIAGLAMTRLKELRVPKGGALLLGLLCLCLLLSASLARFPSVSFQSLAVLAVMFLLCTTVLQLTAVAPATGDRLVNAIIFGGVVAAGLGLYEFCHTFLLGPSRKALIPYLLPPDTHVRVGGPLGQSNLFALFLLSVLLWLVFHHLHRMPPDVVRRWSVLRFLPLLLVATVFFLCDSRSGLIAFGVVCSVMAFLVVKGRYLFGGWAAKKELLCLVAFLVAGLALSKYLPLLLSFGGGAGSFTPAGGGHSLLATGGGTDRRFVLWLASLLIFVDHPLLGVGLDNFKFYLAPYQVKAHDLLGFVEFDAMAYTNWSHNEMLQVLAEGGLVAFFLLLILLLLFLVNFWRLCRGPVPAQRTFALYTSLVLLSFIIVSMFSWPLRHPATMALFFVFLGLLLAQNPLRSLAFLRCAKTAIVAILLVALIAGLFYGYQETRIRDFAVNLDRSKSLPDTLDEFTALRRQPYADFRVLLLAIPEYTEFAMEKKDIPFALQLLPHAERMTSLQGAFWQWYDLARLYRLVGYTKKSEQAIQTAIDLQPAYNPAWLFQHLLNMEKATRRTGRPIEDFTPRYWNGGGEAAVEDVLGNVRNSSAAGQ